MIVYVNSNNEIKDVGVSADTSLTPIEITDGTFDGWSVARICCYKVNVSDGNVTMMTPYIDSRMIDHFDQVCTVAEGNISGAYNPNTNYANGQYCIMDGNLYRFNQTIGRGIAPSDGNYWTMCDVATELNRIVNLIKGE